MSELIAEARVLVTPDTTRFRALLDAELTAITSKPVVIPVTAVVTGGGAGAQQEFVTGARAATESAARLTAATTTASAVRTQFARTETLVADAEKRAALAATDAAAAQIRYNAAVTASRAAQNAYAAALTTTDDALRLQAGLVVAVTAENERLALSQAAVAKTAQSEAAGLTKAAAAQTASLGGVAKGGTSAIASLLGVRGATLAATGPFIAGAAGAIAFGKAISIATSFNSQLAVFAATTGATADEMERVSAASKELGKDITLPGVSAGDAAEAMTEFAKAGLSVNDAIRATRGGLQLATAAQLSNADAVEITASALNAFKLQGTDAVHVADTLANAANLAQGSISDIALGLSQASGAAAAVGVSFEDTTALLTLLAKNGLTASDAGTALRTAFIRLVNPSKQAKEILKDLNVNLRDAQGNLRPEVFKEFADAQKNLATSTQQANSAIVFGTDAFRVIGLLGRENANSLGLVRIGLDQVGTSAKVSGARMVGVAGATANLKNQLEALGLIIGQVSSGPLEELLNQLSEYVGAAELAAQKTIDLGGKVKDIGKGIPGGGIAIEVVKKGFKFGNIIGQINTAKNLIQGALGDAEKEIKTGGDHLRDAIVKAQQEGLGATFGFDKIAESIKTQLALVGESLNLDLAVAQAGGSQNAELAVRRQIEKRQDAFLDALLKRPRTTKNIDLATRAAKNLDETRSAIASIISQQQAAAKAASDKVIADAAAADQTFLQGLADARANQEDLIAKAAQTADTQDNITRTAGLRALIQKQIKQIQDSGIDEKTKKAAIQALTSLRISTTTSLQGLRQADAKAREAAKQESIDAQVALAQAQGNVALQIRLINIQIAGINRQIASGEQLGAALNNLKAQKLRLQQQREDLQDERLANREALGQSILDLTGNKNPLLRAIDAEIKEATEDRRAAKKGSDAWVLAQTAINNLLIKRKEVLKDTSEKIRGFGSFEFMQNQQGFAANLLGNLIPGFATAGLVGNTSAAAAFQPRIEDPRTSMLGDDVLTGNRLNADRGVRPVQVDTTNALLRQILRTLNGKSNNPPEIQQNWRTAFAELDTL